MAYLLRYRDSPSSLYEQRRNIFYSFSVLVSGSPIITKMRWIGKIFNNISFYLGEKKQVKPNFNIDVAVGVVTNIYPKFACTIAVQIRPPPYRFLKRHVSSNRLMVRWRNFSFKFNFDNARQFWMFNISSTSDGIVRTFRTDSSIGLTRYVSRYQESVEHNTIFVYYQ